MKFAELSHHFNRLQRRERWLVFAAAAVLLWLLMDSLLVSPVAAMAREKKARLATAASELSNTQQQLDSLRALFKDDPKTADIRQRDALQVQVEALHTELSALTGDLVKVEALPKILEEVLLRVGNLELQKMLVSPPEEQLQGVYKHGVMIQVSGGFQDVLRYLQVLEQSPWRFYWEKLDYRVQQYPLADVQIYLYTLATEEGGFDV